MASNNNKDVEWAEAKKKCRLNEETVKMAKEIGLNPRSLIKNIPIKSEQWKAPVSIWILEMYQKRQEKALMKKARKEKFSATPINTILYYAEEVPGNLVDSVQMAWEIKDDLGNVYAYNPRCNFFEVYRGVKSNEKTQSDKGLRLFYTP
ncbi:hypothetical protein [Desulfosporosinus fructosivorans]